MEAPGTIVDASGLIVTSLARIDPSAMMASMGSSFRGVESSLQDVKVVLGDGTEVPAQIVLKDTDLDLAFVRIDMTSKEAKGITFKPIDLADSAKVGPGDGIIGLSRADESVGLIGIGILRPGRVITKSSVAIVSAEDVKEVAEQAKIAKVRPPAPKKGAPSGEPAPQTAPEAAPAKVAQPPAK